MIGAKQLTKTTILAALSALHPVSWAMESGAHGHGHAAARDGQVNETTADMTQAMSDMFLVQKAIDGYEVSFHVMESKAGMTMGGSHDLMIKVEKDGAAVTDLVMNTKVVHPNGESQTKQARRMGDWLMASYDLGHEGRHQLMVLFRTADGEKHRGGVYYPTE